MQPPRSLAVPPAAAAGVTAARDPARPVAGSARVQGGIVVRAGAGSPPPIDSCCGWMTQCVDNGGWRRYGRCPHQGEDWRLRLLL